MSGVGSVLRRSYTTITSQRQIQDLYDLYDLYGIYDVYDLYDLYGLNDLYDLHDMYGLYRDLSDFVTLSSETGGALCEGTICHGIQSGIWRW